MYLALSQIEGKTQFFRDAFLVAKYDSNSSYASSLANDWP
jgi:hypothetical protein